MRRMKPEVMDPLSESRDFYALTKAILSLCEPYGPVHSFRFIHNPGASRVACFIELESPKAQQSLAREMGARTLNGAVCLEIPVRMEFAKSARAATLPPSQPAFQPNAPRASLQVSR